MKKSCKTSIPIISFVIHTLLLCLKCVIRENITSCNNLCSFKAFCCIVKTANNLLWLIKSRLAKSRSVTSFAFIGFLLTILCFYLRKFIVKIFYLFLISTGLIIAHFYHMPPTQSTKAVTTPAPQ